MNVSQTVYSFIELLQQHCCWHRQAEYPLQVSLEKKKRKKTITRIALRSSFFLKNPFV